MLIKAAKQQVIYCKSLRPGVDDMPSTGLEMN